MTNHLRSLLTAVAFALASATVQAQPAFLTTTFGNQPGCLHRDALQVEGNLLRFKLEALPRGVRIERAVLRVSDKGHKTGVAVKVLPVGVGQQKPLALIGPDQRRFDALAAVRGWLADPKANQGLRVDEAGGVDFASAVLEISYMGESAKPLPAVRDLVVVHRHGQTFLTFTEPDDVIKNDAPTFEQFHEALLSAWTERQVVYRVYRHTAPIAAANLAAAELVREVPEALSGWNLFQVPTGGPGPGEGDGAYAKRVASGKAKEMFSPLSPGALQRAHVMQRFRIRDEGQPLARTQALAVFTTSKAAKSYYAVSVARAGNEAVVACTPGQNASAAIAEEPAKFPAFVHQETIDVKGVEPKVGVYVAWVEPPYALAPGPIEIGFPRWSDSPQGTKEAPVPLWMFFGGKSVRGPVYFSARRYVRSALEIAMPRLGTMFSHYLGDHECVGTLRGYEDGVVFNHGERLALALTEWAAQQPGFHVDRERVYSWGAWAGFALRHGDVFAVSLSNGHNNLKLTKSLIKSEFRRFGPGGKGKNCFDQDHLDYLDLARWVRDNPDKELPYWVCFEDQGYFPDHTIGDFGIEPWQDFIAAMQETRRAFAAEWNSNGPKETRDVLADMVPHIKLHQTLPAFSKCSFDSRIKTDKPKGDTRFKADKEYLLHVDKVGGINLHQRWDTAGIVDKAERWEITVFLDEKAPADSCTTELTPRRCQAFKAKAGEKFAWSNASEDGKVQQSGTATADRWGLVTLPGLTLTKSRQRVSISR